MVEFIMMKKLTLMGTLLAVLGMTATVARADRPLVSEEPYSTVRKDELRVDAGATYIRQGNLKVGSIGELQVKTGISDNTELFGRTNYLDVRNGRDGLTPVTLGAKRVITNNLAVIVATTTPTGSSVYRNNYEPSVILAGGYNLGNRTKVIGNIGYRRSDTNSSRSNTGLATLAVTKRNGETMLFAETYGTFDKRQEETFSGAIGLSHRVSNRLSVDGRVGRNFKDVGEPNYFTGIGLTFRN